LFYEAEDGETWMILWIVGQAASRSFWRLYLEIPESVWSQGRGTFAMVNDNDDLNFNTMLEYVNVEESEEDGDYYVTEVWRETYPDLNFSELTIHQICEPCPPDADPAECEQCVFSFDLGWFALRAKVDLS
jgi:hypothetical protein